MLGESRLSLFLYRLRTQDELAGGASENQHAAIRRRVRRGRTIRRGRCREVPATASSRPISMASSSTRSIGGCLSGPPGPTGVPGDGFCHELTFLDRHWFERALHQGWRPWVEHFATGPSAAASPAASQKAGAAHTERSVNSAQGLAAARTAATASGIAAATQRPRLRPSAGRLRQNHPLEPHSEQVRLPPDLFNANAAFGVALYQILYPQAA